MQFPWALPDVSQVEARRSVLEEHLRVLTKALTEDRKKLQQQVGGDIKKFLCELLTQLHALPAEDFDALAEEFTAMSLALCDRGVYQSFISNAYAFQYTQASARANDIAIYALGRSCARDAKYATIFLQARLDSTKQVEKKLLLLEALLAATAHGETQKAPSLAAEILPHILRTLQAAVEKYVRAKEKDQSSASEWSKKFLLNFEPWVLGLLTRAAPIVASNLSAYALNYFLDVQQGLLDAQHREALFDIPAISEARRLQQRHLFALFGFALQEQAEGSLHLVLDELRVRRNTFSYAQTGVPLYATNSPYNAITCAFYLCELFAAGETLQLQAKTSFQLAFSPRYALTLAFVTLAHYYKSKQQRADYLKQRLIVVFCAAVDEYLQKTAAVRIHSLAYFDAPTPLVLANLLNDIGHVSDNTLQKHFLDKLRALVALHDDALQSPLFLQMLQHAESSNFTLQGFLLGEMKVQHDLRLQEYLSKPTTPRVPSLLQYTHFENLLKLLDSKFATHSLAVRSELVSYFVNYLNALVLRSSTAPKISVHHDFILSTQNHSKLLEAINNAYKQLDKDLDKALKDLSAERTKDASQNEAIQKKLDALAIVEFNLSELRDHLAKARN